MSKEKSMEPDTGHLHSLIYKFILHKYKFEKVNQTTLHQLLHFYSFFNCCWAYTFYKSSNFLLIGIFFIFFFMNLFIHL